MPNFHDSHCATPIGSILALVCVLGSGPVFAASQDGQREHGAHEHGRGTLDIAVEGEKLLVELRIPAVNVVGFEHAPRDDAEREAVERALVPFRDPDSLLAPSKEAECELARFEAGLLSVTLGEESEDEEHGHGEHEHEEEEHEEEEHEEEEHEEEEHEEEEHDEHEEHEEHEEEEHGTVAEAHSELVATYHFHCHAPERLDEIEVRVFEHLHDAEEIDVRVVTPWMQGAMELHPPETRVGLGP